MDRRQLPLMKLVLLAIALAIGAMAFIASPGATPAAAQGILSKSEPSANSLVAESPKVIRLWFDRPLRSSETHVEVLDVAGHRVDDNDLRVEPATSTSGGTQLTLGLRSLPSGTYTVSWQISGQAGSTSPLAQDAFVFQVGSQGLPGSATLGSQTPSWAAAVLRWLVIVGLSVAAGWFILVLLGASPGEMIWLAAPAGAGLALICDLLLVPATAYLPAAGRPMAGIVTAWSLMPSSWRGRLVIEFAMLIVAAWMSWRRSERPAALAGGLLWLASVATLVAGSHATIAQPSRPLVVADAIHLICAMILVGGLVYFAISPSASSGSARLAFRRYAHLMLYFLAIAIATGAMEAGVILPSLDSLWQSRYGKELIIKLVLIVALLVVLFINRARIWPGVAALGQARQSLRIGAVLGCLTILLASSMALAAIPSSHSSATLNLRQDVGNDRAVHLQLSPADAARDRFDVWLTDEENRAISGVTTATLTLTSLSSSVRFTDLPASREHDGRWQVSGAPLFVRGWWRVSVHFSGSKSADAAFYLLLPDPNLNTVAIDTPTDPHAFDMYKEVISRLTELQSVRIDENLSDGIGNSASTTTTYVAPDKESYVTNLGSKSIAIGKTQWYLIEGKWQPQTLTDPISFPASLPAIYSGPQELTLGQTEMVDGEPCQIITFEVPAIPQSRDEAWYAWWIGTKTHELRQEAMVSPAHYTISHYYDQNKPFTITAPADGSSAP